MLEVSVPVFCFFKPTPGLLEENAVITTCDVISRLNPKWPWAALGSSGLPGARSLIFLVCGGVALWAPQIPEPRGCHSQTHGEHRLAPQTAWTSCGLLPYWQCSLKRQPPAGCGPSTEVQTHSMPSGLGPCETVLCLTGMFLHWGPLSSLWLVTL